MKIVAAALLLLICTGVYAQDLRVIASHEPLSEKESALLKIDKDKLPGAAKQLGFSYVQDGANYLLYSEKMFDIEAMDLCMRGHAVLGELLKKKTFVFKMSDLEPDDRKAVRQLLVQGGNDISNGPVVYDDNAPIRLKMGYLCDSKSATGKKVQSWAFEDDIAPPPDPKSYPRFTADELDEFRKSGARKKRTPVDIDRIALAYGHTKTISVENRVIATQKLIEVIRTRVAAQYKEYLSGLTNLENAYKSSSAPVAGMSLKAVDGSKIYGLDSKWYSSMGFNSKSEAETFLDTASFTAVKPCVYIEMGYQDSTRGKTRIFGFDTWPHRGG